MMDNCDENTRIDRESKDVRCEKTNLTNFWNICCTNDENPKITIESLKQAVVEAEKTKKYFTYTLPYSGYFSRETVYFEPVKIPFLISEKTLDEINK
jgi:hypothetical protein